MAAEYLALYRRLLESPKGEKAAPATPSKPPVPAPHIRSGHFS